MICRYRKYMQFSVRIDIIHNSGYDIKNNGRNYFYVMVAAGAMALKWVLLIAVLVFVEKLRRRGEWTVRLIRSALILLGLLVVMQPGLMTTLPGQVKSSA